MSYSSIACVLSDDALVRPTLTAACAVASAHSAHLDVLCLGVDTSPGAYDLAWTGSMIQEQSLARASEEAETIEAHARELLNKTDLRWGVDGGVAQIAGLERKVARRVRFSDLAVLPRPYGEGRGADLEAITESVLFQAHVPALILPEASEIATEPKRIILAWNESTEALNAARAALPMMKAADLVHVVVIDPPTQGPDRSDPGGLISQYLARHGIKVEVDVLAKSLPGVADVINRHARDVSADLVVMGAYGHSRIREAVFGGATRDMLESCALPVLMAH